MPSGAWSLHRRDAIIVTPDTVVQAVRRCGTSIAEQYFLGTAKHESNWAVNERDMEPPDSSGFRFVSWGIFQLSPEEAAAAGRPSASLLSLDDSTYILAQLTERRRIAIRAELKIDPEAPDPEGIEAYYAIGHNQGSRAMLTTIRLHGVNWRGYKARNPSIRIVSSGYGDDVLPRSS